MFHRLTVFPSVLLCACAGIAHAGIYSFVDADGVVHWSNVPSDDRYSLVMGSDPEGAPRSSRRETRIDHASLEQGEQYDSIIETAAARTRVDPLLLRAIIFVESAFDEQAVSIAGAKGLMQLMPATAERFGVEDVFDPEQNVFGGARFLRELLDLYQGDVELVLAAYNAGAAAVERYGRAMPPYPETASYVPKVLDVYSMLLSPAQSI